MDGKICLEMEFKVLCYLHFLKNKICSDRTKSLQIIDKFNIISKKKKKKFSMGRRFVIRLHPSFYNVMSFNKTPLKSFLIFS